MPNAQNWLLVPYIANILILVPVCYAMLFGNGIANVFEGKLTDSEGLRLLVGSLWTAILAASIAGIWKPTFFAPIMIVQVIYKSLWLANFIVPQMMAGAAIPVGISAVFAIIVVTYPIFLWLGIRYS